METDDQGQAETTPENGTITDAPLTDETTQQTTPALDTDNGGTVADTEDNFFDYNEIKGKPELEAAYKQMQGAFSRKMQGLSEGNKANADKLAAYDAFMKNPQAEIQRMAQQYGMTIGQAQEAVQNEFNPQSWDDVMTHMKQQVLQDLQPVFQEVQSVKKQNIESYMDNNFPDWRTYEDQMRDNLGKHPSMASDPELLYRMSVPKNVLDSRATQAALKKLQAQNSNAQVSGGNKTNRQPAQLKKASSFNEAFEMAQQQLSKRGKT